jgi:hypothetical protein
MEATVERDVGTSDEKTFFQCDRAGEIEEEAFAGAIAAGADPIPWTVSLCCLLSRVQAQS